MHVCKGYLPSLASDIAVSQHCKRDVKCGYFVIEAPVWCAELCSATPTRQNVQAPVCALLLAWQATFAGLTWLAWQLRGQKSKGKMTSVQLITPPISITGQQRVMRDKASEGGVCGGV